jgi:hypothetical protein
MRTREARAMRELLDALHELLDLGIVDLDELRENGQDGLANAITRTMTRGEEVLAFPRARRDAWDRAWGNRQHREAIARAAAESERDAE